MSIELSRLDEDRFGIRSARADVSDESELGTVMDFCKEHAVRFVILRCPVDKSSVIHALEEVGFRLMDTLVFYSRSLSDWVAPSIDAEIDIRPTNSGEVDIVRSIASEALKSYPSHYHADPRLDRALSDAAYVDWSVRSCLSREVADIVFLALIQQIPAGFMTFRIDRITGGGGAMIGGVTHDARRRGVYRSLLTTGLGWMQSQGAASATLSTQLPNYAVQKVWSQLGFWQDYAVHTFHGWFDE